MSLKTGYNVVDNPNGATINGQLYIANDFDRVQVWDGVAATTYDAGIAGPAAVMGAASTSAGNCTLGDHLLRYRYLNSVSPGGVYRSNPSPPLTVTVSGGTKTLTFGVGIADDIVPSTDPKVDSIIIEMTAASGSVYYIATTISNSATTVSISLSDTVLTAGTLATADTGSDGDAYGHEQPPLGLFLAECRGFAFLGGTTRRTFTVTATNSSISVTGTGFSTLWAGRLIRVGSDTTQYEIASSTATTITLSRAYGGTTQTTTAIITSKNPNRLYWSKQYFPESFKPLVRAKDVLAGRGDVFRGIADFMGDLWIFGSHSMQRLVFLTDPATGELDNIPGEMGIWNQRCLVGVDGALFGWGPNGVWTAAGRPRWISRAIDTTANDVDESYYDDFHGAYDPLTKTIKWWYVKDGEYTPRATIVYDLIGNRWIQHPYRQAIVSSTVAVDSDGKLHQILCDSDHSLAFYAEGDTDGVPTTSSGVFTVASPSVSTLDITMNEPLPTAGTGLVGLMVYVPSTGDERYVYSHDATTMRLSAVLSSVPAPGAEVYVGSIPWTVTTDWWTGAGLQDKKRPVHLAIKLSPSATGSVKVYLYLDFASSPYTFTNPDAGMYPDGVTVVDGRNYIVVDLDAGQSDGFVPIPMPEDWSRALRAKVVCESPAGTLRILDIHFAVEDPDEERQETAE